MESPERQNQNDEFLKEAQEVILKSFPLIFHNITVKTKAKHYWTENFSGLRKKRYSRSVNNTLFKLKKINLK